MNELSGRVHVVGAGLLGTSIGLALARHDVEVWLSDRSQDNVRTAAGLGAGVPAPPDMISPFVIVAVPPAAIPQVVASALADGSFVTDVGSVKGPLLERISRLVGPDVLTNYAGSHPMAGSEQSGPLAASAALFDGRPWAITPHTTSSRQVVDLVEVTAAACGATTFRMTPRAHDRAVALTSHLPHLMAVLTAGRLVDADARQLALSGQGVRDVTRIAAGDPALWRQILLANKPALNEVLTDIRFEFDELIAALDDPEELEAILRRGVAGTQVIPGKHGGPADETASVYVSVPDHPGELARLFADVGEIGTNIEDLRIDHDPGRPVGLVELVVKDTSADPLRDALEARDWVVHR
jgi:prephenate dehydrogenase